MCLSRDVPLPECNILHMFFAEKPSMPIAVKAELVNETVPAKIRVSWREGLEVFGTLRVSSPFD